MIEIQLIWLLIGGELLMVLGAALAVLLVMGATKRKRDREAAMHLIKTVKDGEAKRREDIGRWLKQKHGLTGEALDQGVRDMIKAEMLLIQRVANLYVKRDRISLRELNIDVESVSEPFRKLETGAAAAAPAVTGSDEAPADNSGDEALRAENETLKQELQITMETMSRMLSEYASMFGSSQVGGMSAPAMPEEQEEPSAFSDKTVAVAAEELEGLEELDDLETLDEEEDENKPASAAEDESMEVDLSDDDIANLFGPEEEDDALDATPAHEPMKDAEGNEMDDELADLWADALGEQDDGKK